MATYTDNYQLTKPLYSEVADIATINNNMDKVDDIMHNSQISLADAYDQTQTYELGEKVMYEMLLYRCVSRITTPEVWNPDHWERTTAADEGGNYVDVDEKFPTGLNVADIDIDGDQHYIKVPYMTGATSQADGAGGLVPAPEAGDEGKFFKGDGSWGDVAGSAEDIDYDNTESGLVADDVQGAIDEVVSMIPSLPTVYGEASGAIASFADGGDNKPLKSLKVAINPVQASGTPSPENPIPIYGWTGTEIVNAGGINLFDNSSFVKGRLDNGVIGYEVNTTSMTITETGVTFTTNSNYRGVVGGLTPVVGGESYYFDFDTDNASNTSAFIDYYDSSSNWISRSSFSNLFTPPTNCSYVRISFQEKTSGTITVTNIAIYNANVYPITWSEAGTVYGGILDVTSGVLTVTHANIASYNGESINEPWISSEDAYESGATPTTGAQVVYPLTTPLTVQLTPTQIKSLLGQNNFYTDCGDIDELTYIRDINLGFNALWDAVMNSNSGTRSLSLSKGATTETKEEVKEELKEEPKEEEQKEETKR